MRTWRGRFRSSLTIGELAMVGGLLLTYAFAARVGHSQTIVVETPGTAAYRNDPKFLAAMAEAKQLTGRKEFLFAADAYKKANKIAGGRCEECLTGLYGAQIAGGSYKDAVATATAMEGTASSPPAKSLAESRHGQALLFQAGDKPKPAQLEAIHGVLQQAVADYPKNATALYLDGQVLARLGKMEDARAAFEQCLQCSSPKDPSRLRTQHFAENPELSLHKMAPAFEVTALDGQRFNLDAMGGRVVLIDFWATWCGPCNQELPHLQKIAQEFAGQPLVMISVSWDADEAKWKDFIAKNGMAWVQYRDADHRLSKNFGVEAIPHYFTIDSDGVLTAEMMGSGSDVEGKLKKMLKRARESIHENAGVVDTRAASAGTR